MNYEYNPAMMLKIRSEHQISREFDKTLNELLRHGQEIDINTVNADILDELLSLNIAVKDDDKIILNPKIFIF